MYEFIDKHMKILINVKEISVFSYSVIKCNINIDISIQFKKVFIGSMLHFIISDIFLHFFL